MFNDNNVEMELNCGAPHFKAARRQYKNANYTLDKIINEPIDNIIKKSTKMAISTLMQDSEKLSCIRISDNYELGFQDIKQVGSSNPFNMGHMRSGQSMDNETSEFGVGVKAAGTACGDLMRVFTRVSDQYFRVTLDFIKMENTTV